MNKSLTNEITFEKFLCFLGLFYSMEVQKLPERKMYWDMDESGLFKSFQYGQFMTRHQFEEILKNLQFSFSEDKDQQVLDFLESVNKAFQNAV